MGIGKVVQIIGPVIDAEFKLDELPSINNAVEIIGESPVGKIKVIAEVQQQLEGNIVRTVAMSSTDGIMRGMDVVDTEDSLKVPVGKETLGRLFNVLGETIDGAGALKSKEKYSIHREPPEFEDLESTTQIFET
ncbi:MAG: F0F1 ATP synthase subunit beta, partial [Actinomycetia bacterium]|nr:F0F1 ATP synthase subunit beta [Actinomycetes bacterium]